MVFESLVADLLNRFLGDFVENLDSSQLNVGIWGGDVKLENLEVKETALDDLDLPIKLKFGYLSSLVLKIPWKNLYTEPVIANIDGLHLIVVPNKGVVYNEEKAKKNITEIKQKTLARLEEARKNRRKPADPTADSFAEKMVTQIIKNLQISISNIHVRFEDKWTNRHRPFAAGITLQKLDFQTTDENWLPTIHKETLKIIHKLVSLENLAVYWNSDVTLFSDLSDRKEVKEKMLATITTKNNRPEGYKYILEPIKMEAKLQLNQKPETDGSGWSIPKIDLSVDMKALALTIGKFQYQDVLLFLEAQERFTLAGQYLKYRPAHVVDYKGHYKTWWKFAYTSILEEKVRRRRRNWNWKRMKEHRQLVRDYRDAWVKHQTEKSPGSHVTDLVKKAEDRLDVFNINIARQQAEMEIDRKGLTRIEDQPQGIMGWAKSWWGGSGGSHENKKNKDVVSQFEEAMTPEEKAKLFEAIDYQENIPPTNYPKEYVENKLSFRLGEIAINVDHAVSMKLLQLDAYIAQRPSAGAINIKSGIKELRMDGCGAEMLRVRDATKPWLDLEVDTNPLHGKYDQKVALSIAPVTLKYHAPAVNAAADVFKPPESVRLNQLTAAAMSRYEEVKTRSVTGLAHAVEFKKKLVLDISINPATLLISEGGVYAPEKPTIMADLGLLTITTVDQQVQEGMDKMARLREMAYDKFRVKLSNVVIAFAEEMEKAHEAIKLPESPLHILKPTGLDIQFHKSGVEDLSLPKMRIIGDLPDIVVVISDKRLLMLMDLLNSIPTPKPEETPEILEDLPAMKSNVKVKDLAKMKTIMEADEVETAETVAEKKAKEEELKNEQQVQVELDLKLNTIGFVVYKGEDVLADVRLQRFVCQLQMRTFDLLVNAELGSISIAMPLFRSFDDRKPHLYLIDSFEEEGALMQLKFVQANPESPFFATEYHKTEMAVGFKFSKLNIALHQEAFLEVKKFGEALQEAMAKDKPASSEEVDGEEPTDESASRKLSRKISSSMDSLAQLARESQTEAAKKKRTKRKKQDEPDPSVIKMKIDASVGQLAILLGTEREVDTLMAIEKVDSVVTMTLKTMEVKATLQAIKMLDMTKGALHKNLMAVHGDETMLRFEMLQYQRTPDEKKHMQASDVDMKVKLRLAQLRFIFLQLWVNRMQAFAAPFSAEAAVAKAHAQAVASEKSQEALEAAKQMLEQSPPRIELDVELLAPLILVPRLSSSTHVLVVDLGNLIVRNRILGHREYPKAVLDSMDIKLTDVYFGIGRMDDEAKDLTFKTEVLRPITFSLDVHRNLTFGIVKEIPETAVDAHISAINMALSHDDYATMMHTLSGNLSEGHELVADHVPPPPVVVQTEKKEERQAAGGEDQTLSQSKLTGGGLTMKVYDKILFKFVMDNIAIELYTGTTTSATRDQANAFASMRIEGLKLSGHIKEDNELLVAMSLQVFQMNDERKGKTKIPHLLDKKASTKEERFLDLSFKQKANQDKNIRLEMSAFFLCMSPEFLGCLAAFFTVPKTQEEIDREAVPTATKAPANIQVQIDKSKEKDQPPAVPAPVGTITMDCDMKGVEVIIIENSMDPDNTQALILSFNVRLKAEPKNTVQVMHGGVEALRIFSSYYAPNKRKDVTYEVMKSVDIGIAASINNDTKSTEVMLKMTPLELKMAPSVIRLLAAANAEFARHSQAEEASVTANPKRRFFPNYWEKKKLEEHRYWFFNMPEPAEEIDEDYEEEEEGSGSRRKSIRGPVEKCTVEIPRLSFTLEAGNEAIPLPLIFLDMQMRAEASNWSSALKASSELSLQMSYYNEGCSVWEPVIEPLEQETPNDWKRWSLKCNVQGKNKLDPNDSSPGMHVSVEAEDILNITVTRSFINLLTKLGEVFAAAATNTSPPVSRSLPGTSAFLIFNDSGMTVRVANSDSLVASEDGSTIDATHGAFVDLDAVDGQADDKDKRENTDTFLSVTQNETKADLRLELLETVRDVVVGRADKWMLTLPKQSEGGKQWKMLVDVSIENSRRLITLRSHVQVTNHLDVDMEVYSKRDNNLDLAAIVKTGETVNLPVPLLFTPTGELFFKPVGDNTEVSFESVSWHDFANQKRAPIRCNLSDDDTKGFFFETVISEDEIHYPTGGAVVKEKKTDSSFNISLYPPLVFHNNLPFPVTLEQPIGAELGPGEDTVLNIIAGHKLRLHTSYHNEKYVLDMRMEERPEDLQVVALNTESGSAELLLGLHWSREYGGLKAYLYAPFWMVNNTSMTLRHMESSGGFIASTTNCISCRPKTAVDNEEYALRHGPDQNPIILPFPSKDVGQKKKSRVQVEGDSNWSDEFPLETVGNTARVTCKGESRDYDLSVSIQLCQSGLTKIVSFAPFYLVSNCGKFDLEVREDQVQEWTTIPAEKCIGIWPTQKEQRKVYCTRYAGASEESLLFPITENIETLAQINDASAGIDVACTVGESSVTVHLTPFSPGSAPVHVINHLKMPIEYGQKGHRRERLLPGEHVFFTWSELTRDRLFEYQIGEHKGENGLMQNDFGEVQPSKEARKYVYFTSFLNGRQRTLLFTAEHSIARAAFGAHELENTDFCCDLLLQGLGLSVVDNHKGVEVLYVGISSSDILWEEGSLSSGFGIFKKQIRYKPLAVKYMAKLEEHYQGYLKNDKEEWLAVEGKYEANMKRMLLRKKKNGKELKMRRIFERGIYAHYSTTAQRKRFHFKLNHLQIDNQMDACVFPCVLSVVPPPKSVVQDNAPKPFVEFSYVERSNEFSTIPEIEYCKVLVQEFAVRVDQGLINAALDLSPNATIKKPYGKKMFDEDMELTKVNLGQMADAWKSQKPKSYYDEIHISPLMIHLSFSQGGTTAERAAGPAPIQSEFVNVLLKSVGVTLTELQDVVFKLAYFERKAVYYNQDQLNAEVISHYTMQAIKQLYVLVLGLDIIGNPFGLVRDLSSGVEDLFYQPYQGLVQGPEEFISGVGLGVQSLFGHAVGGAAGAVGRITGTVGKGVAALTFDQEYQRKRQEDLNRRPQSFAEGMARGFKGLGMGVVDGVKGVVTKPLEGARQDGFGGFIKGTGKGLVGLAARPISGVVDFASSSMDAVRTVAGTNKDAGPVRDPRYIKADHIIRPYSPPNSRGYRIFKDTDHGFLTETDEYICYAPITDRLVLLVTNLQLVITKRTDVLGTWTVDWSARYTEIKEPKYVDEGVKIELLTKRRGFLGIGGSAGKIITFENAKVVQEAIMDAYNAATK